ncbi:MAG TPA: NADH-quinone oxidoreductase subunit J [Candidatus Deferrimicrobium sp.]|nr:NADH-quinone oxidoreductase subunit J [Candidatus Deferrimicrobium sp.]
MGDIVGGLVFLVFALLTVFSAFMVVSSKNIIHSALFLALSFVGVASLYVLMDADFLAAVQILVYGGAVAIMVVFGVMLTLRAGKVQESNPDSRNAVFGAIAALLTFVTFALVLFSNENWRVLADQSGMPSTVGDISWLLLTKFMVPFEVAAVLLTIAMIGAIILAKGVEDSK